MASHGFRHGVREDIVQLQHLLRDDYPYDDFFTIIKEIVQNSDDAEATVLDVGTSEGIPAPARHPLLSSPGVFFVNNNKKGLSPEESLTAFRDYQRDLVRLQKEIQPAVERFHRGEGGHELDYDAIRQDVTERLTEKGMTD